jgi:hypothetical protein
MPLRLSETNSSWATLPIPNQFGMIDSHDIVELFYFGFVWFVFSNHLYSKQYQCNECLFPAGQDF